MKTGNIYTMNGSRLQYAYKNNMIQKDEMLVFHENSECYFKALDGACEGQVWGRLHIEYQMNKPAVIHVDIRAADDKCMEYNGEKQLIDEILCDGQFSNEIKDSIFESCMHVENQKDILLYGLKGRYLWVKISIYGETSLDGIIQDIKVYQKGDYFLDIFPDIYKERNSFFHRYISIFSDMYDELQCNIEHFPDIFDSSKTPKDLLPVLASWMGIDVHGDFISEQQMRTLVKEAYWLDKRKGTKKALERVAEIVLGEKAVVREKTERDEESQSDITILIHTEIDQNKKAGIMYILKQFKPFQSSMNIVFLQKDNRIDEDTYIDMNATITDGINKQMDTNQNYDNIILQ